MKNYVDATKPEFALDLQLNLFVAVRLNFVACDAVAAAVVADTQKIF